MVHVATILLLTVTLALSASAVFVECFYPAGLQPGFTVNILGNPSAGSPTGCATQCKALGYTWSQYASAITVPIFGQCMCTNNDGGAAWVINQAVPSVASPPSFGTCETGSYQLQYLRASYNLLGCFTSVTMMPLPGQTTALTVSECFTRCINQGSKYIAMQVYTPPFPWITCLCSTATSSVTAASPDNCGVGRWNVYRLGSTPSVISRRQKRLEAAIKGSDTSPCPVGMQACNVAGSDAYECIDPMDELESCGGCVAGLYAAANTTTSGIDCTTIPGVSGGGVTCMNGKCVVTRCRASHQLVDGTCVPVLPHVPHVWDTNQPPKNQQTFR
ncbi:uncharacterized protein EHS24_007040 [Apiotrichum porosum]|uniref:Protein CPL1-like domain-containing protein n=1 Tax=Apiotrichum porosum TaxID=105984 RepID=A0A427XX37_9TREE|nr:uncharacterized protein EHS24_007040 [Apiotrichum porosum]RSH83361.1 hypothetical protein EHS24_007040 [Apiotrichum porosum]